MATIIATYNESNQDDYTYEDSAEGQGMAETFPGVACVLDSCKFRIGKTGAPTGNAVAKLYAITGTFGTNSKPTGAALATSDVLDVTTIAAVLPPNTLYTLNFSGANRIALSAGVNYAISIEYSGGDVTNKIAIGRDSSAPTYAGDGSSLGSGVWNSQTYDHIFYVYGVIAASADAPMIQQAVFPIHFAETRQFES